MKDTTKYQTHRKIVRAFRDEIGKPDVPASWLEFMLMVAESGEEGITSKDLYEALGFCQANGSRMMKVMSTYFDPKTKTTKGLDLLRMVSDHVHRHRVRLFLSEHGKQVMANIIK